MQEPKILFSRPAGPHVRIAVVEVNQDGKRQCWLTTYHGASMTTAPVYPHHIPELIEVLQTVLTLLQAEDKPDSEEN